jgi:hypothetical protein
MDISNPNENSFLMFQSDQNWNKHTKQTRHRLLRQSKEHIEQNDDLLSDSFFSKDNFDIINKQLILSVYKKSNRQYLCGPQRNDDMTLAMRWVWNEYSRHLPYNITEQIRELNKIVVKIIMPDIITGIEQRVDYLKDIENPLDPIPLPQNVNISNKTLRPMTDVLHGESQPKNFSNKFSI